MGLRKVLFQKHFYRTGKAKCWVKKIFYSSPHFKKEDWASREKDFPNGIKLVVAIPGLEPRKVFSRNKGII